jgi:hypothetical protein
LRHSAAGRNAHSAGLRLATQSGHKYDLMLRHACQDEAED